MPKIQENISLKDYTTFQIGGRAKYFAVAKDESDLHEAFAFAKSRKLPIYILGGGSNLLISDKGFVGLIIKNEIKGIKFIDQGDDRVVLEMGAGETLDDVIALSVIRNLYGLENLSGVPGTVGGAAVQNAGAYGVEIKDCLLSVTGLNSTNGKVAVLKKADCQYGYRDSYFKKNKKVVITSVTFELSKKPVLKTEYVNLKSILADKKEVRVSDIREAILKIRSEKLPDWHKLGTAGSFFKNPVISQDKYNKLKEKFSDLPGFPDEKGKVKVPLAWILDKICGLKGFEENHVGLYVNQPLVIVNYGGATEKEVSNFAEKIKKIVLEKTGMEIEMEVEKIN